MSKEPQSSYKKQKFKRKILYNCIIKECMEVGRESGWRII